MRWRTTGRHIDEHLARGYRYALALTHDAMAAEMLVQDAWFAALESGNTRHLGYLLGAIRSRCLDLEPRRNLVVIERSNEDDEREPALELDTDRVPASGSFERALTALRPEEREVLYLAAVERYSAREIGEVQGRAVETVLGIFTRARRKLVLALRHASSRTLP